MASRQELPTDIKAKLLGDTPSFDLLGLDVETSKLDDSQGFREASSQPAAAPAKWYRLAYYQPYFEVDTHIVLRRLRMSVCSLGSKSFFGKRGPDLYCPFWIITTLIMCICIAGNMATFLTTTDHNEWVRGISKVSTAASMLYGLVIFIPLACHCVIKRYHSQMSYIELLSLYGYSWFLFIPASIVGIIPHKAFRAVVMIATALWSYYLLACNLKREAAEAPIQTKYWLAGVALSGHVVFVLSVLTYFYAK
jgi:hypothetical protein